MWGANPLFLNSAVPFEECECRHTGNMLKVTEEEEEEGGGGRALRDEGGGGGGRRRTSST